MLSSYEMSVLNNRITKQPFDIWVDDFGKSRNTEHNEVRFKVSANGVQLTIIVKKDGSAQFVDKNERKIRKFKYSTDAQNFIQKFQKPLMMQWNQEIDVFQLADIIKLVQSKNYQIDEAIDTVLNDD